MNHKAMRRASRLMLVTFGVILCAIAFLRGNHLLGLEVGIAYAIIAAGVLWLLAQSFPLDEKRPLLRAAIVSALSVTVGIAMGCPALINPDIQVFIDKQATDRAVRAELEAVLTSDPAYRGLSTSTWHLKVVNVTVQGSLKNRSELSRLRDRILSECPGVRRCPLHWDVKLSEPALQIDGLDPDLFGAGR